MNVLTVYSFRNQQLADGVLCFSGEASATYIFMFIWDLSVQYCKGAQCPESGVEDSVCMESAQSTQVQEQSIRSCIGPRGKADTILFCLFDDI